MSSLRDEYFPRDEEAHAAAGARRLPPHSPEAEQGVLGCAMLSPLECVTELLRRFRAGAHVFYDLRHQEIFKGMVALVERDRTFDIITLQQWLKDQHRLEEVGGLVYLNTLPDAVPSAANLKYYTEIVLEKHVLRTMVGTCNWVTQRIYEHEGEVDPLIVSVERELAKIGENWRAVDEEMAPKFLAKPAEFQDGVFAKWFRDPAQGEPGLELPIPMRFRIRRKETTLVSADDGAGKSTLLSYFALHLAAQDAGVCIASFEEHPADSIWRLCSQLVGRKEMPDTEPARAEAAKAMAWINRRFWFYNFMGISEWRDVLDTFRYAAEKFGVWLFVIDSVMRIGIADDDYKEQGFAAAAFADFAMKHDAHLIFVIHENKGDGRGKAKVRGSKLWTANAHNVTSVERNVDKGEKREKLQAKLWSEQASESPNEAEIKQMEKDIWALRSEWDTRFILRKQRLMGSQQNGSRRFWYDPDSSQFRTHWEEKAVNWLSKWNAAVKEEEA